MKKTHLYIDGTNLFAGQNELFGPKNHISFKFLKIPTAAVFLSNRFSLEMSYKVDKAFVFNFENKFKVDRKLPKQLQVIVQKKPRMVNIRGK